MHDYDDCTFIDAYIIKYILYIYIIILYTCTRMYNIIFVLRTIEPSIMQSIGSIVPKPVYPTYFSI